MGGAKREKEKASEKNSRRIEWMAFINNQEQNSNETSKNTLLAWTPEVVTSAEDPTLYERQDNNGFIHFPISPKIPKQRKHKQWAQTS